MKSFDVYRRKMLALAAVGLPALAVTAALPRRGLAAAPIPLDSSDPSAKALGYVSTASSIDPKTHPTFKPGSQCANCLQYTGTHGAASGPCNLFPGKLVAAAGWCSAWSAKPA